MEQFCLPLAETPEVAVAHLMPGACNHLALSWLARGDWPEGRLALWGEDGCGKSLLLRFWAHRVHATVLDGGAPIDPAVTASAAAIAVDDADRAPSPEALLHLLNTAREKRLRVLLTGRTPPSHWCATLPDLDSRLRAIAAVEITQADDDFLRLLMAREMSARQLMVAADLQNWLLRHLPRTPGAVVEAVQALDRASLSARTRITRSFAARVLGL